MNKKIPSGSHRPSPFSGRLPALGCAAVAGIFLADALLPPLWLVAALTLLFFAVAAGALGRAAGGAVLFSTAAVFSLLHLARLDGQARFPFAGALERHSRISVTAAGMVDDEPRARTAGDRFDYTLRLTRISDSERRWKTWHRITVSQPGPPPAYGDVVSLDGDLEPIRAARNPGEFDFEEYCTRTGIVAALFVESPARVRLLDRGKGSPLYELAMRSREWIRAAMTRDLEGSPDIAAVLTAMALGDTSETSPEIEEGFRYSGGLHIFAVSGLNVAIFGTIIWTFLKLFGIRRPNTVLIIIPCLFFYAYVTGLKPSAFRAAVMAAIFLSGLLFARQPRLLNSLAASALVVLACDSQQLFLPGFQLSFAVLATIAVLTDPIQRPFRKWIDPDPFLPSALVPPWRMGLAHSGRCLLGLVSLSAAAWAGSAPLGLLHFQFVTPVAILSNCVLVPLAWLVFVIASMSLAATGIGLGALAALFNNANWCAVHALLGATALFASVPGGHFYVDPAPSWSGDRCRVTVLDTGLGGSSQLISLAEPRSHILIDAGSGDSYRQSVLPLLRGALGSRLDGLVITHGDAQHLAGCIPLLRDYSPSVIYQSPLENRSPYHRELLGLLENAPPPRPSLQSAVAGQTLHASASGDLSLRVLYPPAGKLHDHAADDQCVILQLACDSWRILFTADSGFVAEKWLLENTSADALRGDVLIKGHHRSDHSGLPEFLDAVAPQCVIATNHSFPAEEQISPAWEQMLDARGITLFDQSRTGAVTIRCSERRLVLSSHLVPQSVTLQK